MNEGTRVTGEPLRPSAVSAYRMIGAMSVASLLCVAAVVGGEGALPAPLARSLEEAQSARWMSLLPFYLAISLTSALVCAVAVFRAWRRQSLEKLCNALAMFAVFAFVFVAGAELIGGGVVRAVREHADALLTSAWWRSILLEGFEWLAVVVTLALVTLWIAVLGFWGRLRAEHE